MLNRTPIHVIAGRTGIGKTEILSYLNKMGEDIICLESDSKLSHGITIMKEKGFSQIPVTKGKKLIGLLHEAEILNYIVSVDEKCEDNINVGDVMRRNVVTVNEDTPFIALKGLIKSNDSILVINKSKYPIKIITKIDLVEWFVNKK